MSTSMYAALEAGVVTWARTQPDVHGIVVVGSRARPGVGDWSDLDLVLFTPQSERYAADSAWLSNFGPLWLTYLDHTGRGDPEWYALYAGGLKVDCVLHAIDPSLTAAALPELIAASPYHSVYYRGVRALYDHTCPEAPPPLPRGPAPALPAGPTAAEFSALMHAALFAAARAALLLKRGDLWRAHVQCDHVLKQYLLTLLQWHARAEKGLAVEIWDDGRRLDLWAAPDVLVGLPAAFAHYEAADLWRALLVTLELVSRLGRATAERLSLPYPSAEPAVIAWVRSLRPAG